jgi:hypothetical protein
MIDDRMLGVPFNNPTVWMGRFTGTGANVPVAVGFTSRKMTIVRNGTGNVTITLSDPTLGQSGNGLTGVVESSSAWVNTTNIAGTNIKDAVVQPIAANSAAFIVNIQFRNGTAVDLAATDELNFECWTARSQNP